VGWSREKPDFVDARVLSRPVSTMRVAIATAPMQVIIAVP
jgi:hypothetical protein